MSTVGIRAAFLLNFVKFVEWPAGSADRPFTIGVLGDDVMAYALRDLSRGRSVGGRPINARTVTTKDSFDDLHILFVGASEKRRLASVLQLAKAGSVLTVSGLNQFCELGGTIQLRDEHDRVRFDINLDRAELSGLIINSKLLALAQNVIHSPKSSGASW